MDNLEQAIKNQVRVHEQVDDGTLVGNDLRNWRTASLNKNYEYKSAISHGTGKYSVCKVCGHVCECKMEWFAEGTVLLCPECFLDGT